MNKNLRSLYPILLLLVTVLVFDGCASRQITTKKEPIKSVPANFKGVRLSLENIRVRILNLPAQAYTGTSYNAGQAISAAASGSVYTPSFTVVTAESQESSLEYSLSFYNICKMLSDKKISTDARSDYYLEQIDVTGIFPDMHLAQAATLGTASFFIPPLANVKSNRECTYKGSYILKNGDRVVKTEKFETTIQGNYKGWYVAGALQGKKLVLELNQAAQIQLSTKMVNSIFEAIESDSLNP